MKLLISILFIAALGECLPQGGRGPVPPTKPDPSYVPETGPLVLPQFDIKFTEEQLRSGIIGENYRWRGGFYVQLDGRFSEQERNIVNNALYELHTTLCIDVLVWPSDGQPTGDYVFIQRGESDTGCWSFVGRLGRGRQELNLQWNGCIHHGVVMHEAIHALGFYHEQSRQDRDQFVNILWDNIIPEYRYAFNVEQSTTFDVPYDYRSIMHYNSHDFTQNGAETIQAWNGSPVGSEGRLTGHDVSKLLRMYNC